MRVLTDAPGSKSYKRILLPLIGTGPECSDIGSNENNETP